MATEYRCKHTKKCFACQQCYRCFARQSCLKTHLETHNPDRPRPFSCEIDDCTMSFMRQQDLDRHKDTHSDSPPRFVCHQCSRGFNRMSSLYRHERGQHTCQVSPELGQASPETGLRQTCFDQIQQPADLAPDVRARSDHVSSRSSSTAAGDDDIIYVGQRNQSDSSGMDGNSRASSSQPDYDDPSHRSAAKVQRSFDGGDSSFDATSDEDMTVAGEDFEPTGFVLYRKANGTIIRRHASPPYNPAFFQIHPDCVPLPDLCEISNMSNSGPSAATDIIETTPVDEDTRSASAVSDHERRFSSRQPSLRFFLGNSSNEIIAKQPASGQCIASGNSISTAYEKLGQAVRSEDTAMIIKIMDAENINVHRKMYTIKDSDRVGPKSGHVGANMVSVIDLAISRGLPDLSQIILQCDAVVRRLRSHIKELIRRGDPDVVERNIWSRTIDTKSNTAACMGTFGEIPCSALYFAVVSGQASIAELLLRHGSSIDVLPNTGAQMSLRTPISRGPGLEVYLCKRDGCVCSEETRMDVLNDVWSLHNMHRHSLACVEAWVEGIIQRGEQGDGYKALQRLLPYLAQHQNTRLLSLILRLGFAPPFDSKGRGLLHLASGSWQPENVRAIRLAGYLLPFVDSEGNTPFHSICATAGAEIETLYRFLAPFQKVCLELIEAGVDINAMNGEGRTALDVLCHNTRSAFTIETLLTLGANPNLEDLAGRPPAFNLCLRWNEISDWPLVRNDSVFNIAIGLLYERGASLDTVDVECNTILHYLAKRRGQSLDADLSQLLTLLIEKGANIMRQNVHSQTAADILYHRMMDPELMLKPHLQQELRILQGHRHEVLMLNAGSWRSLQPVGDNTLV